MSKLIDLTGMRFGRLVVISRADVKSRTAIWNCRCDCGKETVVYGTNLRRGYTQSCGCYRRECELQRAETTKTHGEASGEHKTRLYGIWSGIHSRCYNPNVKQYDRYGGRGIKMCDEWLGSYTAFRDWALANGYRDDLTIDRIDADGHYCPENCQWLTLSENSRKSHLDRRKRNDNKNNNKNT